MGGRGVHSSRRRQGGGEGLSGRAFGDGVRLFYGIGAQKAGTTWTYDYLRSHPQVHVPRSLKELHYWNNVRPPHVGWLREEGRRQRLAGAARRLRLSLRDPVAAAEQRAWQRALRRGGTSHDDYIAALLAGRRTEAAVGEITPYYALLGEDVLAEMAALSPGARVFYQLRDPVSRVLSGLRMDVARADGTVTDARLSEAVERALADDPAEALLRSRYDLTLDRLDRTFGAACTCVLFYETLFQQPEIDRLCAFLGVDSCPADVQRRVFKGTGHDARIDPQLRLRLAEALRPVYAAVEARIGGLPEAWRRNGT